MFDALEISKDIHESRPIVFGGSSGTKVWNLGFQYLISILSWFKMDLSLRLEIEQTMKVIDG